MRFLHVADLHLGLKITRFGADINGKVQEARLKSLESLLDRGRRESLDFILIGGDLFDDNHVDAATSRRAFELLEASGIATYIISGNHDPISVDSVFARTPWQSGHDRVRVLRTREAVPMEGGVLFACPLFARNSHEDPTRWIEPRGAGSEIRIGLAHGSLNDREHLPADDHLIDRHAAEVKGLDYLALGHWHGPYQCKDRDGVVRTAYPGLHEPMRFHDSPEFATGWSAYSSGANADLFAGDGKGRALLVTIDRPGAAPVIEEIETGRLHWRNETRVLRDEAELSAMIDELARRPQQDSQLLRLHLQGTLPANAIRRLDELDQTRAGAQGGVLSRFFWAELNDKDLVTEPSDEELQTIAGDGVIRAVYDRLKSETQSPDPKAQQVARQALLLLCRFAQEAGR